MVDKIGQPIVPGSVIAYAAMHCYSTGLNLGKVCKVGQKKVGSRMEDRITVRGTNEICHESLKPQLNWSKSTVKDSQKCVVLDESKLEPKLKALFDAVEIDK